MTWLAWMVVVCILWSPFWFNPQTFQLARCKVGPAQSNRSLTLLVSRLGTA
jgi:hypothetical protein